LERSGSTVGQRISRREIRAQAEISRRGVETRRESRRRAEMAVNELRDQDKMDGDPTLSSGRPGSWQSWIDIASRTLP